MLLSIKVAVSVANPQLFHASLICQVFTFLSYISFWMWLSMLFLKLNIIFPGIKYPHSVRLCTNLGLIDSNKILNELNSHFGLTTTLQYSSSFLQLPYMASQVIFAKFPTIFPVSSTFIFLTKTSLITGA